MPKAIKDQVEQTIKKKEKFTPEKVKKIVLESAVFEGNPDVLFDEIGKLLEKVSEAKGAKEKELGNKVVEKAITAFTALGLETHYPLSNTVSKDYKPMVIEVANGLIEEYDCRTTSEKMLAEMVAGTYVGYLECCRNYFYVYKLEYLSSEKNGYFGTLSKHMDRLQRQYVASLTALRQIKSPQLKVNVKAKTAFVSQNQQVNAGVTMDKKKDHEIIESK